MCNNIMMFLFTKNFFLTMIYMVDMAILMFNFDNFDIDQMYSKHAQRL